MNLYPVLMLLVFTLAYPARANDAPADLATDLEFRADHCHSLMTDSECVAHLNTLATLPVGAERSRYLHEHLDQRRERERLCACGQARQAITYYPGSRQAMYRN